MQAPLSPVPAPSRSFRRTALAAVGLTAAASLVAWQGSTVTHHVATHYEKHRVLRQLQEIPSLKLHFHVKRDSMKIHTLSEFDVFANPVIGTLENDVKIMTYDGIAEFEDSGIKHKYILANGVAYHTTQTAAAGVANEEVSCVNGNTLPPIHDILNAINDAQPATVAADSPQQITCASGKLLKMNFAGDQYLLCPEPNASGFTVFGTDFDIAVQFLNGAVDISIPELSEAALSACESVPSFSVVQPSTFDLLSGAGKSVAGRMLQSTRPVVVPSATCGCKGKRRPCIFFHGLNQKVEGPLSDSSTYFGKLGASAPCCTSIKYAQVDTVNQGWNEDAIQKKVCDLSLSMSSTSNTASKTIEDTIIVAHSMGNMMLAGAIATGKCSLSSTSTWVALASPTRGSMGSDFLQNACSGNGGLISLIAPIIGQCPANKATKALAYESEKFADATLKAQYDAAQIAYAKNVGAAMCSDSYNGLSGGDQLTYRLGGTIINHKSRLNDGIVEYQSCVADLPTSNFKPTYESAFYTTKVNHMDMTFRNGDSMTNNQQKPVKWFECLL